MDFVDGLATPPVPGLLPGPVYLGVFFGGFAGAPPVPGLLPGPVYLGFLVALRIALPSPLISFCLQFVSRICVVSVLLLYGADVVSSSNDGSCLLTNCKYFPRTKGYAF